MQQSSSDSHQSHFSRLRRSPAAGLQLRSTQIDFTTGSRYVSPRLRKRYFTTIHQRTLILHNGELLRREPNTISRDITRRREQSGCFFFLSFFLFFFIFFSLSLSSRLYLGATHAEEKIVCWIPSNVQWDTNEPEFQLTQVNSSQHFLLDRTMRLC